MDGAGWSAFALLGGLSQRQLVRFAKVAPSTVGKVEAGTMTPSLDVFQRLLGAVGLYLVVVDQNGRVVLPMEDRDDMRDGAGRRYPSHLDLILDPEQGEWWADKYGLARPPETYHRDKDWREARPRLLLTSPGADVGHRSTVCIEPVHQLRHADAVLPPLPIGSKPECGIDLTHRLVGLAVPGLHLEEFRFDGTQLK